MVSETEDAIAAASSQLVAYRYYTPVIVMFAHASDACDRVANTISSGQGRGG